MLVLAGASGRTLAFGPGHLDGSAHARRSGQCGDHRASRHPLPLPARWSRPATRSAVERADGGTRHFRIRGSYIADYRELHLPRDTAVPTLTLVTCYPFDALNPGGPLRFVVVAEAA